MKDAKGHGSDPRGAHSAGVDQVGRMPSPPAGLARFAAGRELASVPLKNIEPWQLEPSSDDAGTVHYKQQLEAGKSLEPIHLVPGENPGKWAVYDGHHRYFAAKDAGLSRIPAVKYPAAADKGFMGQARYNSLGQKL